MRTWSAKPLLMLLGLLTLALPAGAESKLQSFEKSATQTRSVPRDDTLTVPLSYSYNSTSASSQNVVELQAYAVGWTGLLMLVGGVYSWKRVQPEADGKVSPRQAGESLIPYVRLDASEHRISSNLRAVNARAELGYGPIGFSARKIRYREADSGANLELWQQHALYRMFGEVIELDLGYGNVHVRGVADSIGNSWTLPVLSYPMPQVGIEYRPWMSIRGAHTLDDEIAVYVGDRFWSVKAGYHRLRSPSERMGGAFIGFSLRL